MTVVIEGEVKSQNTAGVCGNNHRYFEGIYNGGVVRGVSRKHIGDCGGWKESVELRE
jgi:hypothetical protein